VKKAGLADEDRPEAPDVSHNQLSPSDVDFRECNDSHCGYLFYGADVSLYESGGPCPGCDKDPRADDVPPEPSFAHKSGLPPVPPAPQPVSDSRGDSMAEPPSDITPPTQSLSSDTIPDDGYISVELVIGELAGNTFQLPVGVKLGRKELASILSSKTAFQYEKISGEHIQIELDSEEFSIMDLGSTNGTSIDGVPAEPNSPVRIDIGSRISLAKRGLVLRYISNHLDSGGSEGHVLVEPTSGVSFLITESVEEVIGRDPEGNGSVHQFIQDIFNHGAMGGSVDEISSQLQTVSRKHVSLKVEGKNLIVTNYSAKGTKIHEIGSEHETLLQGVGEQCTADLVAGQVIRVGKLHFHVKQA